MLHLPIRPRRNRKSAVVRDLIAESSLSASHLIYPMFVQEGDENTPIESLPGCKRWSIEGIVGECARLYALGIRCVDLFAVGLADLVKAYFKELTAAPGAVKATLEKYLG